MLRLKRSINVLLVVCLFVAAIHMDALAGTTKCIEKNVTLCGYTYNYYCGVQDDGESVQGYGTVISPTKVVYPTGYYGICPRLYDSNGTLIYGGNWTYNTGIEYGSTSYTAGYTQRGTYYGKAQMQFYNGNGYNTYNCNSSPYLQRCISIPEEEYEVNANGLTYGSDFYSDSMEDMPDLVRVLGLNGVEGYVYACDLYWQPESLEEVLDYLENENDSYTIPVYMKDGITVVDSFVVSDPEQIFVTE